MSGYWLYNHGEQCLVISVELEARSVMPDKDIVHPKLSYRYQRPYKMICEGETDKDYLSYIVAGAIKKDIKDFGEAPIQFLQYVELEVNDPLACGLFNTATDWSTKFDRIEQQACQMKGDQRGIDIARNVAKRALVMFQCYSQPSNYKQLVDSYLNGIFEANFVERTPLPVHHKNTSHLTVSNGISAVRDGVQKHINSFSSQIIKNKSLEKIIRCRNSKIKLSTMDLLDIDVSA